MKGRQALGRGWSSHETTNTTAKNAANSIVGKTTKAFPPLAEASSRDPHDSHARPHRNSLDHGGRRPPGRRIRRSRDGRTRRPELEHLQRPLLPGARPEAHSRGHPVERGPVEGRPRVARRVPRRRAGRRDRAARGLRGGRRIALSGAPVQAPHLGAVRPRLPRLPCALALDPHAERLERGEPPQPADVPVSGAGGALLQHSQEALPRLPDRGGRRDRRPEHGALDHPLPDRRAGAAAVGPPQLPRQQPAARPAVRRNEAARAHGAGEDLAHRDGRDREVRASGRPHAVPVQREARAYRRKIQRLYVYHWRQDLYGLNRFDAALIRQDGRPRPSYYTLARWLRTPWFKP